MFIYFRVCEKQETISYVDRYLNASKTEIIKKCWKSFQDSVTDTDTIFIIHDNVSKDTLDWLQNFSVANIILSTVPEHDWDYHGHTVHLINILEEQCKKYPNDIHYIVEDDYLHVPNAISILKSNLYEWPYFATSYDYPDRYTIDDSLSRIIIGTDRHWRTVNSCTMSLMAKGNCWSVVIDLLKQAAPTSNDKIFETIFQKIPCISPMPGLSSHMTDRHLTPLVDWLKLWETIQID